MPFQALGRIERAWLALVFVASLVYLWGLNSPYAPTNGDEMVYVHIARMTAESGNWLPLQSEIVGTRNTKPPLLFWQAMVAGQWGDHWTLAALRLPSILYTFATTAILAFFTWRFSGNVRTACLAAVLYLLFFSTFRYGRVYLTSAPETFWLALPMWWLLWRHRPDQPSQTSQLGEQRRSSDEISWGTYSLFGVALGLGAAYKSFALIAPAAAALWCAVLYSSSSANKSPLGWSQLWRTTAGVSWSTAIGLAIFALWFVLDPDPASVWQEFVVAENAGKMSNAQGYWHAALWGAYPMWTQLLAYPENAGLLFFIVVGLFWGVARLTLRTSTYTNMAPHHRVLLVWLVVWLVIFTIPSQRSARYLIPVMPALAIVLALLWDRIATAWFALTLLVMVPALIMLARIGWVMGDMGMADPGEIAITLIAACAGITGAAAGLTFKPWRKAAALTTVLAVYATFTCMVQPLSNARATYGPEVQTRLAGRSVAVPNGFTGQYERFHFVLRGAKLTPYDAEGRNTGAYRPEMAPAERLDYLLSQFDAVIWLQDDLSQVHPTCAPTCQVIGTRWHVKSRHKSGEITWQNLWHPEQWLFRKEWLVSSEML